MSRDTNKIQAQRSTGEDRAGYKPAPPSGYVRPAPVKVPPAAKSSR